MYFKGNERQNSGSCCQQDKLKKTKLNAPSEARGKIMAAVANKATNSHDKSGMYSICKEENDRIEYTHIIPCRP